MTTPDSRSKTSHRPHVIGLTGNIACGKSAVLTVLRGLGAITIDADHVYHELIRPGEPLWRTMREHYGASILAADETIDRRVLGEMVFEDAAAMETLDQLTHPAVVTAIQARLATLPGAIVVIAAVKLIESGLDAEGEQLWVVVCDPEQQVERLMARNKLSRRDAVQRVRAQFPIEAKAARATVVIDNSGTLADTRRQVEAAWHEHVQSFLP
ncbi:MAG: dephospho-CoA kinase [Chloroflexota bacterium]|nr:dephospho-CoA kinase [Chloroflexota bacterium]